MVAVQDMDPGRFLDVAGLDLARALGRERQALGRIDFHLQRHALEVQDDVGHVLAHAGDGRKFMQHVVDLHRGDGRAQHR